MKLRSVGPTYPEGDCEDGSDSNEGRGDSSEHPICQSSVYNTDQALQEAYPLIPSAAIVFLTTSIAPLYCPGLAVCILTFLIVSSRSSIFFKVRLDF